MKEDFCICKCESPEHQILFRYFQDDLTGEVYVSYFMKPSGNFFTRIWRAIKYVFGYKSMYGDFDEFIFRTSDIEKVENILVYLKKCKEQEG